MVDKKNLYQYQSTLQNNNNAITLTEFSEEILKLIMQTETELLMHTLTEIGKSIATLNKCMLNENQEQTKTIISAVKQFFKTNQQDLDQIKEDLKGQKANESAINQISQKTDNIQDELKKLKQMLEGRDHSKAPEFKSVTQNVSVPVEVNIIQGPIQNERDRRDGTTRITVSKIAQDATSNIFNEQEFHITTAIAANMDQADAASTNPISETATEGKLLDSI